MADYKQLRMEWAMIKSAESEDWSQSDLQLAAELGKTLLERNKELEAALRHHQNIVDDQEQEIEYLRKQTQALREVNDSRLRIYEQLEVSIGELEVGNQRLTAQANADKKHIQSLESQIERLEGRCEELERRLSEAAEQQQQQQHVVATGIGGSGGGAGARGSHGAESSEVERLKEEANEARAANTRLNNKLKQLQSTLDIVTQENLKLEEKMVWMERRQEELIEQNRSQNEICPRCLRTQEEISSMTGDEDDASIIGSIISEHEQHMKECTGDCENPYRRLVEKYEALLRVERVPGLYRPFNPAEGQAMSLQEELEMSGGFFHREEEEDEIEEEAVVPTTGSSSVAPVGVGGGGVDLMSLGGRPEASETSSGFSDETATKATQTEDETQGPPETQAPPGSFLCSITDGDDCKFSIYDEANAVESRFRKTPEYRRLFREIFDVLKRAAEAKDEGESLPLLEDMTPVAEVPPVPLGSPKAPPVSPTGPEEERAEGGGGGEEGGGSQAAPGPSAGHRRWGQTEGLAQGVGGGSAARRRRGRRAHHESPSSAATSSSAPPLNGAFAPPPRTSGRRKRENWRARGAGDSGRSTPDSVSGAGGRRSGGGRRAPQTPPPDWFTPTGSASKEVAKLRQLEKSYAEVLRLGRENINRK